MENLGKMRIPDILETIADLSNDEVFTPPDLANKVLDMLPKDVWKNSEITFLDPACKTGVFLREITKRLIVGLENEIPDLQERVNHILTKQVYGLGITELTTLMSRRTLYCATRTNSEASVVTAFDNEEGNIKLPNSKHKFNEKTKKCEICGAGKDLYDDVEGLDNYAYSFLHDNLKEVFGDVKFDVIIGNPPYQLNVGNEGGNASKSVAIYNLFIDKAKELNPKYISMIIPSRWMTSASSGISSDWVSSMLNDKRFKRIVDFENADNIFKNVGIMGGINYFLWDRDYIGKCDYTFTSEKGSVSNRQMFLNEVGEDIIIKDDVAYSLFKKVENIHKNYHKTLSSNFSGIVAPFDLGEKLSTDWRGYSREKNRY